VVDDQGAPLPGVTVTVQSKVLIGGIKSEITDERGEFAILGLPPGVYELRADLDGFVSQEWQELKVRLGGAAAVSIELASGTFADVVQVIGETPVIDPTQVNVEQIFDQSYLENASIGSAGRIWQNVLYDAGGTGSAGDAPGNPSVFGSVASENVTYIDGLDITDPITSTFGANFNFDAIQEIQFQTGGYEAEYGRAIGGVVNLVTKSGGNKFSGALDVRYKDESFYTSGDHYDTDELKFEDMSVGATLGGPIVRDKLWFFAAYEYNESDSTPVGASTTRHWVSHYPFLKLSWQINPAWRAMLKYTSDPTDIDNVNSSPNYAEGATRFQEQGGYSYNFELNAVLSDSLLWNTMAGIVRGYLNSIPQSGDLASISHWSYATGVQTRNYYRQDYSNRDRDEFATDLTWFVSDLAGSHEFKFGFEYGLFQEIDSAICWTGDPGGAACETGREGFEFWDHAIFSDEHPWVLYNLDQISPQSFEGPMYTGFVQDAWRPVPNLTIKAGLRYDDITWKDDQGAERIWFDQLQPRIGFAYDITGDAKNVVRGSWGRFMHPANTSAPSFLSTTGTGERRYYYSCTYVYGYYYGYPTTTPEECAAIGGPDWRLDPDGWDPAGWLLAATAATDPTQVDPNLKPAVADEWTIAYERALWDRTSIEFSWVNKETNDLLEDTCIDNIPEPVEGGDCPGYYIFNAPERKYTGAVVRLETRSLDWLTLLASYTYGHSRGSADSYGYFESDWDVYPWDWVNLYGYLMNHRRHRVKLNGFVLLPYDFTIGFNGYWSSKFHYNSLATEDDDPEIPFGHEVHTLPRGTLEANDTYQLDLQVSKGFTVGNLRIELIGAVLNALDNEQPSEVCEFIGGCANPEGEGLVNLGSATKWQVPRRYEVGLRLEF
jgi:hypothetical protein